MLTGNKLIAKNHRGRLSVGYLDPSDARWGQISTWIINKGQNLLNKPRYFFEEELNNFPGTVPDALIFAGLVKVFSDICRFEDISGIDPVKIRDIVFSFASQMRSEGLMPTNIDVRNKIFEIASNSIGVSPKDIDSLIYSDLESENKFLSVPQISPQHLIHRYNLALAQGALLNSTKIIVKLPPATPPPRLKQLMRWLKFNRLLCAIDKNNDGGLTLVIDGPLSLFRTTQKYGLQIALFLPALLLVPEFDLEAELIWGKAKKSCKFLVSSYDGLVTHYTDSGMYRPPENEMFMQLFRKRSEDWEISDSICDLEFANHNMIPDFVLTRRKDLKKVGLEILWSWNTPIVEKRIKDMEKEKSQIYVLAVADKGNLGQEKIGTIPKNVYLFKSTPLAQEIEKIINLIA